MTPYAREAPLGLILAGGLARRMQGAVKPLLQLGTGTLLDELVARLNPQVGGLALNTNDPEPFSTAMPILADPVPGHPGPLAGVLAGLDQIVAVAGEPGWLLTVSGDTPFIPPDLVARLARATRLAGVPVALARSAGRSHPTVALWSAALRAPLHRALVERDLRRVAAFQAEHAAVAVDWADDPDPFFNINTPADLAEAERRALNASRS